MMPTNKSTRLLLPVSRAEPHRPDIARPGIGADQIWLAVAADTKAAGLDRCETEMPVRANNPQRMVGRTSMLNRSGHAELSSSVSPIDLIATAIVPQRSLLALTNNTVSGIVNLSCIEPN